MDYPRSEWERIMKIQEVFHRAHRGKLSWREAAEILRVDERTVRRWKQTIEENGYEGLLDRRRQTPSPKRASERIRDYVKKLYRDEYSDWNVKHFHEQLNKYGIGYKYTWVKNLLQESGFVPRQYRRTKHRRKRPRKPLIGMMLHIDGSKHPWIPSLAPESQDLIAIVDDATSDVYYAKLVPEENTVECMLALKQVVMSKGVFCSMYSDRATHFFYTPEAGRKVDLSNLTQIGRALYELGIETIPAYSPEARGRSERLFRTWQGRLPQELKREGIKTIPDANRYILEVFLPWYKKHLVKEPLEQGSAFTRYRGRDLDLVFSLKEPRMVNSDNTIQWSNRILQLEPSRFRISFAKCKVMVYEHLDRALSIYYGPHLIGRFESDSKTVSNKIKIKQKTKPCILQTT